MTAVFLIRSLEIQTTSNDIKSLADSSEKQTTLEASEVC